MMVVGCKRMFLIFYSLNFLSFKFFNSLIFKSFNLKKEPVSIVFHTRK
jgi:hypothetical protein